jgi:hypothetical protein
LAFTTKSAAARQRKAAKAAKSTKGSPNTPSAAGTNTRVSRKERRRAIYGPPTGVPTTL